MGTAGGEPRVLLNALKPMLGVVGDIKTPQEVMRVVGMMKDAEKLMSRCVYLNILKATCRQAMQNDEKKETLHKFLATGGWGILNKWLMEFTKSENFPVLLELIEVLKVLPITVDLLKQGNTGKLMKSMTKLEHSDVKKNASGLIKQWKNMIRIRELKKKPANENEIKADPSAIKGDQDEKKRKLSDPQSKQVSDSSGFMNALNIASPPVKKKRRTSNDSNIKKATLPLDEILKNSSDDKTETDEKSDQPVESPEPLEDDDNSMFIFRSPAVEAANAALAEDNGNNVIIDEGSLARKKNKKKRNITWAPDDQLVQISYFELMEGEKKGSHAENFSQARQLELLLEKQAMRAVRRGEDRMVEKVEWRCLIPVDNAGVPNFVPGEKSREKFIQAEREKTVLAYIFLTKQSLPDNPSEPDFDPEEHNNRSHQPTMIPHDEERTILPPRKSTSKSTHQQPTMSAATVIQPAPVVVPQTTQPKPITPGVPDLVSPAVQNIMTQLLRNNVPSEQQQQQQQQQPPPQQPPPSLTNIPTVPPPIAPNMGPSILGQPGLMPPIMRPPFPNTPPPNMNPQLPNNVNTFMPPPREPNVALMEAPTNPSMRGQGNRGVGPRFQGGRGFNNIGRGGGDAGFPRPVGPVGPVGPGPRPRWNGPPNQGPPPNKRNGNWDESNYDNNFHDEKYNDKYNDNFNNYNENYNDEFRGGHNENGNFGRPGQKDGFRNGGGRGRGFGRGMDNSHRGRGGNGRGRGGNDRDRYSGNNDWGYDNNRNNGSRDRRNGDWNRDDRNYGHGSNRGRDHRNNGRDGSRPRDGGKVPCQHFMSGRGCRNGDHCKYSHVRH